MYVSDVGSDGADRSASDKVVGLRHEPEVGIRFQTLILSLIHIGTSSDISNAKSESEFSETWFRFRLQRSVPIPVPTPNLSAVYFRSWLSALEFRLIPD